MLKLKLFRLFKRIKIFNNFIKLLKLKLIINIIINKNKKILI